MTGRSLYNKLLSFADIDVTEEAALVWIDLAQKKASLDLPVVQTVVATDVEEGGTVSVPEGVFRLISAVDSGGEDYSLSNITVNSNNLVLAEAVDSITITYSGPSPTYDDLEDELTIHPSLHGPLLYFLISIYYDMEGEGDSEESGLAERYYQRWVYYRNLAISCLEGTDNNTYLREPVSTTDELPSRSSRAYVEEDYFE